MAAARATPTLVGHTTNRDEQMTALDKRFDRVCEGQLRLGALIAEVDVR
jgi:hypothetical protein